MMAGSRASAGEAEGWPLFVHVETRRRPRWHWATVLLVSVCVVCFVGLAFYARRVVKRTIGTFDAEHVPLIVPEDYDGDGLLPVDGRGGSPIAVGGDDVVGAVGYDVLLPEPADALEDARTKPDVTSAYAINPV